MEEGEIKTFLESHMTDTVLDLHGLRAPPPCKYVEYVDKIDPPPISVDLSDTGVTDTDLQILLRKLGGSLRKLTVRNNRGVAGRTIHTAALVGLHCCPHLELLDLQGMAVDDHVLPHFRSWLPRRCVLNLRDTNVTEAGRYTLVHDYGFAKERVLYFPPELSTLPEPEQAEEMKQADGSE